jgi:hypothetical protein
VDVTASNAGGSADALSPATGAVAPAPQAPTNTSLPVISDAQGNSPPQVGDTLNATNGAWNGNATAYAYQWRSCSSASDPATCSTIGGATSASYAVAAGDLGNYLRVDVTATSAGGSADALSAATGAVAPAPPTNTGLPTISDALGHSPPQVGDTLNATNGAWNGNPTAYAYQWRSCGPGGTNCADIAGANQSSYTVASGDVGQTLVVRVRATNVSGTSSADSAATGPVAPSG